LTLADARCTHGKRCRMNIDLLMLLVLVVLTGASVAYVAALTKL
jgi:hypothetical protein